MTYNKEVMSTEKILGTPSIRRLPLYLHIIKQIEEDGTDFVSATFIANELNLEPIQIRKDLAITGIIGKPKKGYHVKPLIAAIEHFLGWDKTKNAVLIGAGNLGTALSGYQEFKNHGLNIIAAFDKNHEKVGKNIHGISVYPMESLQEQAKILNANIAVLTLPSSEAQEAANIIVAAGIKAIWNFTNVKLKVPEDIVCQQEDLTSGYAMLCIKINESANAR